MKTLFTVFVLLVIGIVGVGFCQGWFHITTHNTDQKSSATISVDKDKIRADEGKVKEKVEDLGHKAKEKTGERTGMVTEGEHRQ
jgi:predicted negative regulator of RcsB-dependent stress response